MDSTGISSAYCFVYRFLPRAIFADKLEKCPVLFFGDGADKCQEILTHPNAHFELGVYPSAKGMVELAQQKFTE